MGKAKKTLILTAILMMIICMALWADANITAGSTTVGKIMVSRSTANDLSASGSSPMHFLDVSLGATNVQYNANATASDTHLYGPDMIVGIITNNGNATKITGTITATGGYIFSAAGSNDENTWNAIDQGLGNIPYLCVLVKVSGTGQTTSGTISNWYTGNSYEVVGIIDTSTSSLTSAEFTLDEAGQCIHIIQVPFAKDNTVYFPEANVSSTAGSTLYYTRYNPISLKIYLGSSSYTFTEKFTTMGKVENDETESYSTSFGFTESNVVMSVSQLLANNSGLSEKAASLNMSYSYLRNKNNNKLGHSHLNSRLRLPCVPGGDQPSNC